MRRMIKHGVLGAAVALGAVMMLSACTGDDGRYGEDGKTRVSTNYGDQPMLIKNEEGTKAYGARNTGTGSVIHQNAQLTFSKKLSDEVNKINGVSTAIVMLTERNAYVAVMVDDTATGTRGSGARDETNNSGTSLGQYNPHQVSQGAPGDRLATGYNSYETVEDHNDLSHRYKQTIAVTLRRLDPSIHDVFISANREFVNQMNRYQQESWSGRSLNPYVQQFNETVNRIFSTRESTGNP